MADQKNIVPPKDYQGPVSAMRESPWLSSEDLEDPNCKGWREVVVTISGVKEIVDAQFKGGRTKAKCYALVFAGKDRWLVLNGVNRETCKELFGRRAADWIGKQITLYVKPDVRLGKQTGPGIRIKPAPEKP